MRPKYFVVYFSTYGYKWIILTYGSNKREMQQAVRALNRGEYYVDGDPAYFDARIVTNV
jgi:hypothetical protein